ncbi:hypothetical protein PFDG_03354 [Plasmodium falciparum Dd2]|uniref:Uncharacterized protein n=1 Tax=Plasmodium falciparum (isolate Dd2) TaxID=57267 RepID=A0A0L7M774_PLAF4|nr:hypothetical protein PFDG_03354 [Plasmodium falciparum Dd2]
MNKTNYTKNNIMGNLLNYEYVQYHNFYKRENEEKYFKPAKNNNDEEKKYCTLSFVDFSMSSDDNGDYTHKYMYDITKQFI